MYPPSSNTGLRKNRLTFSRTTKGVSLVERSLPLTIHHIPSPSFPAPFAMAWEVGLFMVKTKQQNVSNKQNKLCSSTVNHLKSIHYRKVYWFASWEVYFCVSTRLGYRMSRWWVSHYPVSVKQFGDEVNTEIKRWIKQMVLPTGGGPHLISRKLEKNKKAERKLLPSDDWTRTLFFFPCLWTQTELKTQPQACGSYTGFKPPAHLWVLFLCTILSPTFTIDCSRLFIKIAIWVTSGH